MGSLGDRRAGLGLALAALLALVVACDGGGGGEDPCRSVQCIHGPSASCEGSVKVSYQALGECTVESGMARCDYPALPPQDCATLGKICRQGACVDPPLVPCEGVVCADPPAPDCDGDVAQIYAPEGSCDPTIPPAGGCVYPVDASLDCAAGGLVCRDAGCVDPADFPCDPNPCDVPPLGTCSGASPVTYAALGACADEGGAAACSYAPTTAAPCAADLCYAGACASSLAAPAASGDLVITEIMRNPASEDDEGEWIELYNPQPVARALSGCTLSDDDADSYTFAEDAAVIVPAKGRLILGRSASAEDSGGLSPDHVYAGFVLANGADEVTLSCGGVVIDRVAYAAEGWPFEAGAALSLRPELSNAVANDVSSAWCDATTTYGTRANKGTPRKVNPPCP
ncbi:MAG: hypothetical protein CSA66_06385 [Proteobacteria bacterium]|nr:MAG: hypothetical protein CSA66_06385 [Pseudomonadota bacterium]